MADTFVATFVFPLAMYILGSNWFLKLVRIEFIVTILWPELALDVFLVLMANTDVR